MGGAGRNGVDGSRRAAGPGVGWGNGGGGVGGGRASGKVWSALERGERGTGEEAAEVIRYGQCAPRGSGGLWADWGVW